MDLKETLKTEIQEGKHDVLLGFICMSGISGCLVAGTYAISKMIHKTKYKKEIDKANLEGFLKGYLLGDKVNKILERDEKNSISKG